MPPRGRRKNLPAVRGLSASDVVHPETSTPESVTAAGGLVLASYRDPLGGHLIQFVSLPIEKVVSAPFQRDLSETHVKRLADVVDRLDRFLDPVILVEHESTFWTPNGAHRLEAMKRLGARAIVGLLIPEKEIAYQILALNTEKSPNLKDRALEVIRLARILATIDDRLESGWAAELTDPALLTLGPTYEARPRFSGSAYHPILKKIDPFLDLPLAQSLPFRAQRTEKLLVLDEAVSGAVSRLKTRGFTSPYLKGFVIARISPRRGLESFDEVIEGMTRAASTFDAATVNPEELASVAGAPVEEE